MTVNFLDDSNSWANGEPKLYSFVTNDCPHTHVVILIRSRRRMTRRLELRANVR